MDQEDQIHNLCTKHGIEVVGREMDRVRSMLQELVALNANANEWAKSHNYPLIKTYPQYPRARELGEEFRRLAGFRGMQSALGSVRKMTARGGCPDAGYALLEHGWEGIGGWQP